jgi:hypothetical protein
LSHNKIHLLPTLEECRDAAKQRSREEWQRKTLNEDMLSEDIIVEIQEDCSASSRNSDSEDEKEVAEPVIEIKSCLKKPPVVVTVTPTTSNNKKKSSSSSKKNQNKRKRSHSKSHVDGNTKKKLVLF